MTTPQCPRCHGATTIAGSKPYCSRCGWNRDATIANLQSSLKMIPVGVAMFGGFIAFMISRWHMRNPYQIAILCGVPTLGIALNYLSRSGAWPSCKNCPRLRGVPANH